MVGTLSLCPPCALYDPVDFHLSGKSAKTCRVPRAKIFRFRSDPNHRHNSARLTADEGRFAIVTNTRDLLQALHRDGERDDDLAAHYALAKLL